MIDAAEIVPTLALCYESNEISFQTCKLSPSSLKVTSSLFSHVLKQTDTSSTTTDNIEAAISHCVGLRLLSRM
jgi:hypothetical protein